ncbi:GAF domain-containing protein [Nonomuraea sp. NPDC050536]|uniref:GAF domain-containing protein n=1 Tax=Nonomuraea sp. NPDC050536 TaxID=3364366 RepID=UPI0037C63BEB
MDFQELEGFSRSAARLFAPDVHDELLRSSVRLARLAFGAAAASVFLYDRERDELVFEASSGVGEDRLIGLSIPAGHGIAGWVWSTGETILVRDVDKDDRFDRQFATDTGYVPSEIIAAPLELGDEPIGVIEVLDAQLSSIGHVSAMDLLTELAQQCCSAISLLVAARALRPRLLDHVESDPIIRLEAALSRFDGGRDPAAGQFVIALADLLERH